MKAKYWFILIKKLKKIVFLRWVSPSRPAPAESPRLGTEQGCAVERCDGSSLPFFYTHLIPQRVFSLNETSYLLKNEYCLPTGCRSYSKKS